MGPRTRGYAARDREGDGAVGRAPRVAEPQQRSGETGDGPGLAVSLDRPPQPADEGSPVGVAAATATAWGPTRLVRPLDPASLPSDSRPRGWPSRTEGQRRFLRRCGRALSPRADGAF